MKALILLGGLGTRLRPLTLTRPKPLLPVLNRPLIAHQLDALRRVGVREVVLALGYKAAHFKTKLGGGSRWGVRFRYSIEREPLGTGGAIRKALGHLEGTTMVLNGDIISDIDLRGLTARHARANAQATLALTEVKDPSAFGLVQTDRTGRVIGFLEKPSAEQTTCRTINAGVYVFEPEVVQRIPEGRSVSIEREIFPALIAEGYRLRAEIHRGYWSDVGTLAAYWRTHADLHLLGRWPAGYRVRGGLVRGPGVRWHRTALQRGTAVIGRGARVDRGAVLEGCVTLGDNVRVGAGARLTNCIVLEGAVIGDRSRVDNAVLGAGVGVGADCRVGPDLVLGDGARWPDHSQSVPGLTARTVI
ncbi:MAG: NDP-sugar synthase [Elusimicrobia bacterium]|nr:NDP-sugar synthase [Elusimicrobiota bacterium]